MATSVKEALMQECSVPDAQSKVPPRKITIVGVGQVGMACAYSIMQQVLNCYSPVWKVGGRERMKGSPCSELYILETQGKIVGWRRNWGRKSIIAASRLEEGAGKKWSAPFPLLLFFFLPQFPPSPTPSFLLLPLPSSPCPLPLPMICPRASGDED